MKILISTPLACSLEQAISYTKKTKVLQFVTNPLIRFSPIDPPEWPIEWRDGAYLAKMRMFGFFPLGQQAIVISFPQSVDGFQMRDKGFSPLVKVWDHTISIKSENGQTLYTDSVIIKAGIMTLPIWLFAHAFYRYRQRRWRRLAHRLARGEACLI